MLYILPFPLLCRILCLFLHGYKPCTMNMLPFSTVTLGLLPLFLLVPKLLDANGCLKINTMQMVLFKDTKPVLLQKVSVRPKVVITMKLTNQFWNHQPFALCYLMSSPLHGPFIKLMLLTHFWMAISKKMCTWNNHQVLNHHLLTLFANFKKLLA